MPLTSELRAATATPKRSATSTVLGQRGEAVAQEFLLGLGYVLLTTNYRCAGGEVDIIAYEQGVLCFIEVRTRVGAHAADPLETIGRIKQQRLVRAAGDYLQHVGKPWPRMRFDAVGVLYAPSHNALPCVTLVRDAFET